MTCEHVDYDDYFGKCFECGAEYEDIDAVREWLMYEHGTRDMEKASRLHKGLEAK